MNEFEPEWYNKLKGSPVNRKTFTAAHMEQVEQRAARLKTLRLQQRQASLRKMWVVGVAAVIIIVGIVFNYSRLEDWTSTLWPGSTQHPVPAGPDQQEPPKGIDKEPEQQEKLYPVKIKVATGVLKDALPFDVEQIQDITIYNELTGVTIKIPKERQYVVTQNLAWINLDVAKAENVEANAGANSGADHTLTLKVQMAEGIYTIPYNFVQNTVDLDSGYYYADDKLLLLVKGLVEPDSRLAEVDRILEQARVEFSEENSGKVDESFTVDADRLMVDGKDYATWQNQLLIYSNVQPVRFYDSMEDKVKTMGEYGGEDNLIVLNAQLLFASSQFKTKDGVGVGLTKQEVLAKLGKPNLETETEWGYKSGDYLRFFLYFDAGVVKYMSITMPA